MKTIKFIHENGDHKWAVIARDPSRQDYIIDTNEYLVMSGDQAMLCDPGGLEVFPAVFSALSTELDVTRIQYLFSSHQDPDIISSIGLWLEINPDLRCYLSWLWCGFIPHFGGDRKTFMPMPDEGMSITLGDVRLAAVPAHCLHSSGNFNLYDPKAKILFSGDIGSALLPSDQTSIYVEDFDSHIRHAEGFHRRWMGSNEAKRSWCERVSQMEIEQLCPQHGAIYCGDDVMRFINWFAELDVGSACRHG